MLKRYKVAQDRTGTWGILDRVQCKFAPFGRKRLAWRVAVRTVLAFDVGDMNPWDLTWVLWKPRGSAR
ncbi:hypothetical protein SEA_JACKO_101 [Microbacterium phage Jacko]|nr:hypothetical protein SEA_JACKO_101 [Microbacterium phage Jacko]